MKIAIYDSKNKDRLLGQLDANPRYLREYAYEVPLFGQKPANTLPDRIKQQRSMKILTFYPDVRQVSDTKVIDEATEETTVITRKCFLTDDPLFDLMKLDRFFLPDETSTEQRRRLADCSSTRDFY